MCRDYLQESGAWMPRQSWPRYLPSDGQYWKQWDEINNLCKGTQEGRPGGWVYMLKNRDIAINCLVSKG